MTARYAQTVGIVLSLVGMNLLAGCGGGGSGEATAPAAPVTLLAGSQNTAEVWQYHEGPDGTLASLSPPALVLPGPGTSRFITVHPSQKFFYVSDYSGVVAQFRVEDGGLVPLAPAFVPSLDPGPIAFSPDGQFAFVVDMGRNRVLRCKVNSDGTLQPLPGSVPTGQIPDALIVTASPPCLYVVNAEDQTISQYRRGDDGSLTPLATATVATGRGAPGETAIVLSPNKDLVYVTNPTDSDISGYHINADGNLVPLLPPTIPTPPVPTIPFPAAPSELVFDPAGRYAYVDVDRSSYFRYEVQPDETLAGPMQLAGSNVAGIAFSPDGRFAYAGRAGEIDQFSVDAVGGLHPLSAPSVVSNSGIQTLAVVNPRW